jgi:site-specific DNA recombinase
MRCAVYARVSSLLQRDRETIASQLRVLPEFVERQGWTLAGTYTDDGRTAKAGNLGARTGLAALLRDAAAGLIDVVAVVDIDRLTRSEDLAERGAILGALQRTRVKVAIAATGQVLDLSDSMGDLISSLGAYFAAEWARKHRTRIVEGKLTAIARGKKPAGPTPYGYRYDRHTGVWSIQEDEAAIVREVFERCRAGEAGERIAANLAARGVPRPNGGEWIRERVYAVLKQPAYRGEWTADKARGLVVGTPRIVSDELWFGARDREASLARRLRGLRRTMHTYLVEAIAVCGICGDRIGIASASTGSRRVPSPARYVCGRRRRPDAAGRCPMRYWLASEVDERVWAALHELVTEPGRLERAAQAARDDAQAESATWERDLAAAERHLAGLARTEAAILARFRRGAISEAAMDLELAAAARDRVMGDQQVEAARRAQFAAGRRQTQAQAMEALLVELRARTDAATPEQRRALATALLLPGAVTLTAEHIELAVGLQVPSAASMRPGLVVGLVDSAG